MTIGVTHLESQRSGASALDAYGTRGHEPRAFGLEPRRGGAGVGHQQACLPVDQIVGAGVTREWAAVAWRQVLEKLDPRPVTGAERGDPDPRARHVVELFLLRPVILALAR